MQKQVVRGPLVPETGGPFDLGVRHGDTLCVSGLPPFEEEDDCAALRAAGARAGAVRRGGDPQARVHPAVGGRRGAGARRRALLIAAVAGCAAPAAADPAALTGGEWTVAEVDGQPPPNGASPATIGFGADGRAAGSTGCNRWSGAVTVAAGALSFGPAAMTRMACAGPGAELERRFAAALERVRRFEIAEGGRSLTLQDEAGAPLLRLRR